MLQKREYCFGVVTWLQMEHVKVIVCVFCLGGPGFCSMSPEVSNRAANHSGDAHGWQTEKTVWGFLMKQVEVVRLKSSG